MKIKLKSSFFLKDKKVMIIPVANKKIKEMFERFDNLIYPFINR